MQVLHKKCLRENGCNNFHVLFFLPVYLRTVCRALLPLPALASLLYRQKNDKHDHCMHTYSDHVLTSEPSQYATCKQPFW